MWVVHVMHNGYGNFFVGIWFEFFKFVLADFFCSQVLCFAVFILDGIRLELEIQPFQINWF
jgi:hypothetical protein